MKSELFSVVAGTVRFFRSGIPSVVVDLVRENVMSEIPKLGVFTEGWPGLQLRNLALIDEQFECIDWHAPLDEQQFPAAFDELESALLEHQLQLDSVVFGLPGESYASPAEARATVGFAAPGCERRASRFRYAKQLIEYSVSRLKPNQFVRGVPTFKGHFGAFDENQSSEYAHLVSCLRVLSNSVLDRLDALLLSETGCESADDICKLFALIGSKRLGCNWDTANLRLWDVDIDNAEYARTLTAAGLLRGVHIKGGMLPSTPGTWGTEISPTLGLIREAIELLQTCPCFDGGIIVEREIFLGDARETQVEKSAGLNEALRIARSFLR